MDLFALNSIQAWGGLAVILGLIGFLLGKFFTDENILVFKAYLYKPIFAVFRSLTMWLNGMTGGWWNSIGEPYFIVLLNALFMTILQAAVDGLNSDVAPQVVYKTKTYAVKVAKRYTL